MMSPIQLIKEGILEEDWAKISAAYKILSGEDLQSQSLLTIEAENEPDYGDESEPEQVMLEPEQVLESVPGKHFKKNLFFDNGSYARAEIKADKQLRKTTQYVPPRPKVRYVDVTCRVCNRPEKVKQHFAPNRNTHEDVSTYVCNRCSSTGCKTAGGKV